MQTELINAPKKKKKWIIIGVVALIVIIAGVNIAVMQSKKKGGSQELKFVSVTEKTLHNTKLVSGRIVPGSIETIYADPTKGKVKEIFVKEGDEVQKGQKLFSYESSELSLQVKQAELDKKMTAMRYDQGKEKISSLKKDIQKAKDAGADDTVLQPLEAQLKEAEFQQKSTELEVEKNKLQMQELDKKQNDLVVYSNTNGIVQKLDKDAAQGSAQAMGQAKAFVQIASKDPFQVQGTLTELQKAQIQKDQTITVTAKAVADKKWKGKITEVSEYPTTADTGQLAAEGQQSQMISYYSYKAVLDSQDGLSPGYHVSLQVDLSSKKMLAVPRSSVTENGDSPYVYVEEKGKLHKQNVTTGMSDGEWIEVLEGLKEGEKVVKNPSKDVRDGMEVKAND
ncbi:efflux RND transporter periplasmic adaptor subunit [Ectobacillus panaciterrae]|uniref:efflux RND transporter periplasmic adaptor subunit n=1 Tax=Ectobacillus panaciterrae TaxID=363872 RepID=UPI000419F2A1|nr:efflux RND transporter periplasmic adaptor subunit [Ectobacillus panaciterrae]